MEEQTDYPERFGSIHPLDQETVKGFISDRAEPSIVNDLNRATRPTASSLVEDGKSAVEAKQRRERVQTGGYQEEIGQWVLRVLYEETFGVTPVITLGGILTHHYREGSREEVLSQTDLFGLIRILKGVDRQILSGSVEEGLSKLSGQAISEAAKQNDPLEALVRRKIIQKVPSLLGGRIKTDIDPLAVFEGIGRLGVQTKDWRRRFSLSSNPAFRKKVIETPRLLLGGQTGLDIERGWQFLQAYDAYYPELIAPCKDELLMEAFGLNKGTTKIEVLLKCWKDLGGKKGAIDDSRGFISENEKRFDEVLKKLLVLRSSPDFEFLYRSFSASEAIKERLYPRSQEIRSDEDSNYPRVLEKYMEAVKIPVASLERYGLPDPNDLQVLFPCSVLEKMGFYTEIYSKDYAQDLGVELGGYFIGKYFTYRGKDLVVITDVLVDFEAEKTREMVSDSRKVLDELSKEITQINEIIRMVHGKTKFTNIGDFHVHPGGVSSRPSDTDISSWRTRNRYPGVDRSVGRINVILTTTNTEGINLPKYTWGVHLYRTRGFEDPSKLDGFYSFREGLTIRRLPNDQRL